MRWSHPLFLIVAAGCGTTHAPSHVAAEGASIPDAFERAPDPSPRLGGKVPSSIATRIDEAFEGRGSQRVHVQLDRPLYRPGETVWIKTWSVASRGFDPSPSPGITYELVDPRGQVVETKQVAHDRGAATNDFVLGAEAPGGRWTLRATLPSGEIDERPFVVSAYQAPRIRKQLEFVREGYGPGDRVDALLELARPGGGPLADHPVRALFQVAGETVHEETLTTDASGAVLVSGTLPGTLRSSDGLLTVLVEEGGVAESISRSIPIVLADLRLTFLPEGGDLIVGLPGRVYFEATNRHGEPADVAGTISDDRGEQVAVFESVHDGMGRFAFTAEPGRSYTARVTSPEGLEDGFALPAPKTHGCTLRAYDDLDSSHPDLRVAVRCSIEREVVVAAMLREAPLDTAAVEAGPRGDAVVYLHPERGLADQQGAVRVTVFDRELAPLAERLVYRNRGRDLNIRVTPDRERYGPRDEVVLQVETTDPAGGPVEAEIALAVVDDAVLSLADDEEGHMLSRLYLEPELVESPEDPGWYFDPDEVLGARGLDLVMGTRGWRRFDWQQVWNPEPVVVTEGAATAPWSELDAGPAGMPHDEDDVVQPMPEMLQRQVGAAKKEDVAPMAPPPPPPPDEAPVDLVAMGDELEVASAEQLGEPADIMAREAEGPVHRGEMRLDDDKVAFARRRPGGRTWAPVRVFPRPDYRHGFSGTRSDFRDTVHWEPTLRTGSDGRAELSFYLSDAVTTFRITAEGLGAGFAGHSEETLTSVLPVSVATKLPAAVSAGDRLVLPVTVTNTREDTLDVGVSGSVDSGIVEVADARGSLSVPPGASATHWIGMTVGAGNETTTVHLEAEGGGLSDRIERPLRVVPAGFPRAWSAAGQSDGVSNLAFQLDDVVPDSLTAEVTWHPGAVSTLISGMDGLIQSPGGCFEQTSSTNWPNVAILSYLEAHDGDPRLRVESGKALDIGYAKLTGYQVEAGGFETWGSGPGKEALSAFGLLQFADMKKVYPVADAVLSRDADYLLARRNGKGGFENSGESAHGYGSAPAAVLDGFIAYALVSTGHGASLARELDHQAEVARTSDDPYVLALAARSLLVSDRPEAAAAVGRLAALQADDGSFPGAESSITRSYEANLLVESTALAALALLEEGGHRRAADRAATWLIENRQGSGTWGATQATALALSALTAHAEASKVPRSSGTLSVEVNGKAVGTLAYTADQTEPLVIAGWQAALRTGDNRVVLRHDGGEPLPFTVDVAWTALEPTSAPGAELSLVTALDAVKTTMGNTVRLTATVENQTERIVPSPIARIGLPAGLEPQLWQLQQLQERGDVAFFETRLREVTLYWDGLHPGKAHAVDLDLVAAVPGTFTGPASSAYPYYNDDEKAWAKGLELKIARP